jgi:hypothetical protein
MVHHLTAASRVAVSRRVFDRNCAVSDASCTVNNDGGSSMKDDDIERLVRPTANLGTRIVPVRQVQGLAPGARDLFERAYSAFAPAFRAVDEPGLAVVVLDEASAAVAGTLCLRARPDRHATAIVGRHDRCDLQVAGNDDLALRQLAVVLSPVRDWRTGSSDVSFRILDLRTTHGMLDESFRPLRALRSEGPAIVRCAGYVIYALPVGDPTDWPESAADAWSYMPERVYFDELARVPDASVLRPLASSNPNQTKVVFRVPGPRDTAMQLVTNGDLAGRLVIEGSWGRGAIEVGIQALREGILLGRYARCDAHGLCSDESLSRVHALLLLVDERLLVIDIASTNGTREVDRPDAPLIELVGNAAFELGPLTRVSWSWSS